MAPPPKPQAGARTEAYSCSSCDRAHATAEEREIIDKGGELAARLLKQLQAEDGSIGPVEAYALALATVIAGRAQDVSAENIARFVLDVSGALIFKEVDDSDAPLEEPQAS